MINSNVAVLIVVILMSLANAELGSTKSIEFESRLRATNCAEVWAGRAFDLRVLGRSFPVPSGYYFQGIELGRAVFRRDPEGNPWNQAKQYSDQDTPAVETLLQKNASRASISYNSRQQEDNGDSEELRKFEALEWNGLKLYLRSTVVGHGIRIVTYQVVVHAYDHDDELTVTAVDSQVVADMVACAEER